MTDLEYVELAARRAAAAPGLAGYGVGALLNLAKEIARISDERKRRENSDASTPGTS